MNMLNNLKRITLRLPDDIDDKIWKIHTETRESINSIIIRLITKGLDG